MVIIIKGNSILVSYFHGRSIVPAAGHFIMDYVKISF